MCRYGETSRVQIKRQPRRNRVITALRTQGYKRRKQRRPEECRRKYLKEMSARLRLLRRQAALKDGGFGDMTSNPHCQQCRQQPNPEHRTPRQPGRKHGEEQRVEQRRNAPTYCPAALYCPYSPASVFTPNRFANQHRPDRPLAAKSQALQAAKDKELREAICESAKKRKERKPENRDLQDLHPSVSIRSKSGEPSSKRRQQESRSSQQPLPRLC